MVATAVLYTRSFLYIHKIIYRVAHKSRLLVLAVNEINASQTRVSFAKFIPKLVEKMFDMCSIVPNYSFRFRHSFILLLMNVCDSRFHSVTSACFNWSTDSNMTSQLYNIEYLATEIYLELPTFQSWTVRKMIKCLTQGLLSSH